MLLGTLGASMLGSMLTRKGVMRAGKRFVRVGKLFERAWKGYDNMGHLDKKCFVPLHPLSNIEITQYFNYEPRFNGVYSRDNLPRIKDGAHVIN